MSALGHKRTFAVQEGMSALPPKALKIADIVCRRGHRPHLFFNALYFSVTKQKLDGAQIPVRR